MDENFWHRKWQTGDIAFHESDINPLLTKHFEQLNIAAGGRVLLPLCGKTRAIAWLLARGYRVAGVELSELAVKELFSELGIDPLIGRAGDLIHYRADRIDLFVGDIFALSAAILGPVEAIYDRAALVALPENIRNRYTAHLIEITAAAPQLLISYEYNQQLAVGPPFSISEQEITRQYAGAYRLSAIESKNVVGGMKGKTPATETAWLLQQLH